MTGDRLPPRPPSQRTFSYAPPSISSSVPFCNSPDATSCKSLFERSGTCDSTSSASSINVLESYKTSDNTQKYFSESPSFSVRKTKRYFFPFFEILSSIKSFYYYCMSIFNQQQE